MRAARFSLFDRNRPSDQLILNGELACLRRVSFFFGNEFSQIAASLEAACEVKRASHACWVDERGIVTNSLSRRERRDGETAMLAGIKPRPCCHTRRSERPSTV
jgi:hypothetical protein